MELQAQFPDYLLSCSHTLKLMDTNDLEPPIIDQLPEEAKELEKELRQITKEKNEAFHGKDFEKLSSAYQSFASDIEKNVITKSLQETKDWLYEDSDEESDEHDYTGKLDDLKKLLGRIEKIYKDEKAKASATKELLTLIAEYRSATDPMPSRLKQEL